MYARGMTVREIQGFRGEQYGTAVSPDAIISATDAVLVAVTAIQQRPVEPMLPVIDFDAPRVKSRALTMRSRPRFRRRPCRRASCFCGETVSPTPAGRIAKRTLRHGGRSARPTRSNVCIYAFGRSSNRAATLRAMRPRSNRSGSSCRISTATRPAPRKPGARRGITVRSSTGTASPDEPRSLTPNTRRA
jgi:hypothetical protein